MMVINAWSLYFLELLSRLVLPHHNIVPHTSWHDPPYHKTMKKYEDFEGWQFLWSLPRKFVIRTWFWNCQQLLWLFHIVFECSPSIHDQGKVLVLPNRLLCCVVSTSGSRFCFFPANFMSSTYTDKNNPFSRCTKRHSQFGIFSQPCFNRISQIAFPIIVLPEDDRTDSAQEERLGLPFWTMISAICVVVDGSKCLDIPMLDLSRIWEHLPFLPGYKQVLRLLLVHRNLAIWKWYPWFGRLSFEMLMVLVL